MHEEGHEEIRGPVLPGGGRSVRGGEEDGEARACRDDGAGALWRHLEEGRRAGDDGQQSASPRAPDRRGAGTSCPDVRALPERCADVRVRLCEHDGRHRDRGRLPKRGWSGADAAGPSRRDEGRRRDAPPACGRAESGRARGDVHRGPALLRDCAVCGIGPARAGGLRRPHRAHGGRASARTHRRHGGGAADARGVCVLCGRDGRT